MRHVNNRLLIAAFVCLGAGYIVSWAIMSLMLDTTLRLYGFTYLSVVAVLLAILLLVLLDKPLKLGLFEFPKGEKKKE